MPTPGLPTTTELGEFGLSYSQWPVGGQHALVVTPVAKISWNREMLEQLRVNRHNSERDVEVVQAFRTAETKPRLFVFRGATGDASAWIRFDSELDQREQEELCDLLFATHVAVLRSILAAGAQLFVYVDWPASALDLFRGAMGRIGEARKSALEAKGLARVRAKVLEMDLWVMTRLTLYCAQSFADVIGQLLPTNMPLFDRRAARVAKLLEGVPAQEWALDLGDVGASHES